MRRSVLRVLAFVSAALCSAWGLWAQQALSAAPPPELNEIVVTATRIDSPILETPSFVTVVTAQQIKDSGASDLSGVLSEQSGLVVKDYGPQGSMKTVSVRGSSSNQVLVLLDGMRLNSSRDGEVDLSQVPVEDIDHVEVVRGSGSTMYGTGAIGGVINIITKKPRGTSIDVSLSNGSYLPHDGTAVTPTGSSPVAATAASLVDHQVLQLSLSTVVGELALSGGGSLSRGANAFMWDDSAVLGGWRQRNNAQNVAGNAFGGVSAPLFGGTLSTRATIGYSDIGTPGSLLSPSSDEQKDTSASASVAWQTDHFLSGALTLDVKSFYRYEELQYLDPYFPGDHHTHSASLDLTQKLTLSEALSAVYGGSAWYDYGQSTNFAGAHDRLNLAGFLSVPFSPLPSLTITPSVRYDYFSDFAGSFSAQLGAVLALADDSSLKAQIGSAYRAPTFNDLYWSDPYFTGNPNLKPETSYSAEAGYSLAGQRLSVDASVFSRLVFDQIAPTATTTVNISETLLPGAELHAKLGITDTLSLEAQYTFIYSLLLSYQGQSYTLGDNIRVPYVPLHDVRVSGSYEDSTVSASIDAQYVGEKFTDPANTPALSLAGYVLVNAGAKVALNRSMSLSLKLLNILNETYFTSAGYGAGDPGFPMPPFSIETGVQLHL